MHQQHSHAAEAFRTAAAMIGDLEPKKEQDKRWSFLSYPRGANEKESRRRARTNMNIGHRPRRTHGRPEERSPKEAR